MMSTKTGFRDKGFTLVELLVVIAILSVLAALLLPSFSSAMREAKQVQCLQQHRQIGMGCLMFAEDARGSLPAGSPTSPHSGGVETIWKGHYQGVGLLYQYKYIEDPRLFFCPACDMACLQYDGTYGWVKGPSAAGAICPPAFYRSTFGKATAYRPAKTTLHKPGSAIYADRWDIRLKEKTHLNGYSTLFLDGSVRVQYDNENTINAIAAGVFNTNYAKLEGWWRTYFNRE